MIAAHKGIQLQQPLQQRHHRRSLLERYYLDVRYVCGAAVLWVAFFSWSPSIFKTSILWVWSVKKDWRDYERARNYQRGNVRIFSLGK